ncbi:HlyC/CorC family transporter [bacterium]|nr:HlyC/CorC family transporter [bacterium]
MISEQLLGIALGLVLSIISYFISLYKFKVSSFSGYDMQKHFQPEQDSADVDDDEELIDKIIVSLGFMNIIIDTCLLAVIVWFFCIRPPLQQGLVQANIILAACCAIMLLWLTKIILPCLIGSRARNKLSPLAVLIIRIIMFLFYPLCILTGQLKGKIVKRTVEGADEDEAAEFEEEIRTLIDEGEKKGILEKYEGSLFHSVVEFSDTVVREVMTPRLDIVAVEINEALPVLIQRIIENGYSRIPCYTDRIDNINGVIFAKDLLTRWGKADTEIDLHELLREAYFIPETKKITQLLKEFQKNKNHMAIVVDEYGGVSGLVTIEDLIEEIVGEIRDEYDNEVDQVQVLDDGSLKVDARVNVEELEEYFKITIDRTDFDTVGGLIFHILGRVPKAGEEINYENLIIKILSAEERRVLSTHIMMRPKVEETHNGDK